MRLGRLLMFIFVVAVSISCTRRADDTARMPLLEVEGKFLYLDQVQDIIPPNVNKKDSSEIAESFIRKWVTDVLLYENAKRNVSNKAEIDKLLEEYRKSLTIQQYQQKLIEQRLPKEPSEEEMRTFYDQYSEQFVLNENLIKGMLLVVPSKAAKLANVRNWVQSGNTKALENIEKYSIQNAISYDYFGNKWTSFAEILRKMPIQIEDPAAFVANHRFYEVADSTRNYFLRIESYKRIGEIEPFEMAKPKISNLILNKLKAEFITNFENELYKDAIDNETVTYFKNK